MKLKILMMTEDFKPILGGVPTVVEQTAEALSAFADVTVATVRTTNKEFIQKMGSYRVVYCNGKYNKITMNMQANLMNDKNFKRYIENEKFDIIHCHFPLGMFNYALKIGKKYKIPVLITCHSIFYPNVLKTLGSKPLSNLVTKIICKIHNRADKVLVVTQYTKNYLKKFSLSQNSLVFKNAINPLPASRNIIDEEYELKPDDFILTSVGRLYRTKNNHLMLEALNLIKRKDPTINIKHLIVGDGEELENLQHLVSEYGLQDNVIFVGAVRDRQKLADIYARTNLVSFPSIMDSAGLIQIEASQFSVPTLGIEDTAVTESMQDMYNGVVVKENAEYIANKILYLYNDRDKLKEIGLNAHKTLYRSFEDESVAKELIQIYTDTLNDYNHMLALKRTRKLKKVFPATIH